MSAADALSDFERGTLATTNNRAGLTRVARLESLRPVMTMEEGA